MFYNKKLKELEELFNTLQEQYLKLRREHWELIKELDEIEKQDDKIDQLTELVEKLSKELEYKTWVVTQYILKYPDYMEKLEKKRSQNNKRTPKEGNEGVEL
jgi:cupin superfamily acireductone dioxygenase involved in methionine salvage